MGPGLLGLGPRWEGRLGGVGLCGLATAMGRAPRAASTRAVTRGWWSRAVGWVAGCWWCWPALAELVVPESWSSRVASVMAKARSEARWMALWVVGVGGALGGTMVSVLGKLVVGLWGTEGVVDLGGVSSL